MYRRNSVFIKKYNPPPSEDAESHCYKHNNLDFDENADDSNYVDIDRTAEGLNNSGCSLPLDVPDFITTRSGRVIKKPERLDL